MMGVQSWHNGYKAVKMSSENKFLHLFLLLKTLDNYFHIDILNFCVEDTKKRCINTSLSIQCVTNLPNTFHSLK